MPAQRIAKALTELLPEPLVCWCEGLSLEARYSSSVSPGGGYAPAKAIGGAILRHQLGKARLAGAVAMPRYPVIALTADRVYVFDGPLPTKPAMAVIERDRARVIHGGNPVWRRIDLLAPGHDGAERCYTMMVNTIMGSRKRLDQLIGELGQRGQPA